MIKTYKIATGVLIEASKNAVVMILGSCNPTIKKTKPFNIYTRTDQVFSDTSLSLIASYFDLLLEIVLTIPAATTASTPDTLNTSSDIKYTTNGVNICRSTSTVKSSIPRLFIHFSKFIKTISNIKPTITPPSATKKKLIVALKIENVPVRAAARANLKHTIPEASFIRPSPSIM